MGRVWLFKYKKVINCGKGYKESALTGTVDSDAKSRYFVDSSNQKDLLLLQILSSDYFTITQFPSQLIHMAPRLLFNLNKIIVYGRLQTV